MKEKHNCKKRKKFFSLGLQNFSVAICKWQFSVLVLNGGSHLLVSEGNLVGLVVVLIGARAQAGELGQ